MSSSPTRHFADPRRKSHAVIFAGKAINLYEIANQHRLDHSYLSRIFSGQRTPSLTYAAALAAILGMTLDAFTKAHKAVKREKLAKSA